MTAKKVVVADYGSGNLRSVQRALERTGAEVTVTADLDLARDADGLVVPGVGAFAACMEGIDEIRLGPVVAERLAAQAPVLGICVGMQVFFDEGVEHGVAAKGLGLLPGVVSRLDTSADPRARIPHIGWNTVSWPSGLSLFDGLDSGATRFYFVHSYAAPPVIDGAAVATTVHGAPFAAAVRRGALSATQFHPEKSGDAGAVLLANWVGELA